MSARRKPAETIIHDGGNLGLVDAHALCRIRLRHRFNDLVYRDRRKRSELAVIDTRDGIVSTIRRRGHDAVELVGFFDWGGSTDRRVPGQQLFDLL